MKTIYYHGKVYDGSLDLKEAFVVEKDRFIYVGTNEEALRYEGNRVDLNQRFVCPGFNDSHMHLLSLGNTLDQAALNEHTTSLKELLTCLKDFMQTHPFKEGEWFLSRGWNQDYFSDEQRMPTCFDLDEVSRDLPIVIVRACGHCLVVNSKVLELLNLDSSLQVEGGLIVHQKGQFFDNAMNLVYEKVPPIDKESIKKRIKLACQFLNSFGITSCQSDDFATFMQVDWHQVHEAYLELEKENELTVRIYEQSQWIGLDQIQQGIDEGLITGTGTNMYQCGPLKILGDGALGARSAYLSQPYHDDPTTHGIPVYTKEIFDSWIDLAHRNGMQIATHAIGDACLDLVLDAYEATLKNNPRDNHRHGIVHCQITRPDQLKRIQDLNLHIYAQTIFLDYDIKMVEARVGKELASTSYSWKTLMNAGNHVSNGSDGPVEIPDVLKGIQCALTRCSIDGSGPYLFNQRFSVQEALDSFTKEGAYASFEEDIKGIIKENYLADFVILDQNPFEVEPTKVKDIKVLATYLGHQKVY